MGCTLVLILIQQSDWACDGSACASTTECKAASAVKHHISIGQTCLNSGRGRGRGRGRGAISKRYEQAVGSWPSMQKERKLVRRVSVLPTTSQESDRQSLHTSQLTDSAQLVQLSDRNFFFSLLGILLEGHSRGHRNSVDVAWSFIEPSFLFRELEARTFGNSSAGRAALCERHACETVRYKGPAVTA